jgi:hypothetical protein
LVWKRGAGSTARFLIQNSSPKTLADEVKEAIKKRVDDIEN